MADELFMTGTAAEVTPIRSIDDIEIGTPGPVTQAIRDVFMKTVTGQVERYAEWLEHVPKSAPVPGS
jgi:branched-chain amino acid aminotransferase